MIRIRKGSQLRVLLLALVIAASTAVAAGPALAGHDCSGTADQPADDNQVVWGWSALDCSFTSRSVGAAESTLQRHRWFGWETLDNDRDATDDGGDVIQVAAAFNCNGTGTYTYRTIMSGEDSTGESYSDISSQYRSAC